MNDNVLEVSILITYLDYVLTSAGLIEKCAPPWMPYNVSATKDGIFETKLCGKYCTGKGFRSNQGQLICFNGKDIAHFKFIKKVDGELSKERPQKILCDCGIVVRGMPTFHWMSCNLDMDKLTREQCKKHCRGVTVYFYKRKNKKKIVFCEKFGRNEFFQIHGEKGHVMEYSLPNKLGYSSVHRECLCGIKNEQMILEIEQVKLPSTDKFEECSEPWHSAIIWKVSDMEVCNSQCQGVCNKGKGFYHGGKPFCYHYSVPSKRRSTRRGGKRGECECGYVKTVNGEEEEGGKRKGQYVDCIPKLGRPDMKSAKVCNLFCEKNIVYLYRSHAEPLNIRCLEKADAIYPEKPVNLVARCDEQVHSQQRKIKINFMVCRCGLSGDSRKTEKMETFGKFGKNVFPKNGSDERQFRDKGGFSLGVSWRVKKKRSLARSQTLNSKYEKKTET